MVKSILGAATLAATGAACAQSCTYVDIARAQENIGKMVDASAKDAAGREVALARGTMAAQDRRDCVGPLQTLNEISRQQAGGA